ncbi:MAG: 5'/3'-nucleotidase SurE [Erysipelotrichaceae bacterium]|nr:5'/3'-nucleotidase SurE [Erysipelotrichaceae bacterium]
MKILVSNDDGINAPGIHSLARALKDIGDVTVVAPATQQTAKGHSLTIGHEIRVQKRYFEEGIPGYAVWGTPKDCIDLAVDALLDHRPDLIVTGINEGPNICNDCVSSGTLGGAIAGFINGIPSIATSLDVGEEFDYDKCSKIIREIALWFLQLPYNTEFALNVNFPNIKDEFKGIVIAESGGFHSFDAHYEVIREDEDSQYYVIPGGFVVLNNIIEDLDHDIYALTQGYAVMTPVHYDMVHLQALDKLRKDWNSYEK